MGVKAISWAWEQKLSNPSKKLILLALADHANDEGLCWPGIDRIVDKTELSRRTVISAINSMPDQVEIVKRGGLGEGRLTNLYRLKIEQCANAAHRGNVQLVQGNVQMTASIPLYKPSIEPSSSMSTKKYSEDDLTLAKYIYTKLLDLNPEHKKPNFEKWADIIRLMRERDKKPIRQIKEVFDWANNDAFWQVNILSPSALRKSWDRLYLKSQQDKNPPPNNNGGSAFARAVSGAFDE